MHIRYLKVITIFVKSKLSQKNQYAVILAGGIGSRFWPVSRTAYPKQFLDMLGTGTTLLQQTYARFRKILPESHIFIATLENYTDTVAEQLPGLPDSQYIVEPLMRNTAPIIAYASHKIHQTNPDACIVFAPADHLILDEDKFGEAVYKALDCAAQEDWLITLGIKPTRPDTGYGYIQSGLQSRQKEFKKVKTFTEKPNSELAHTFIQSGDFLWNAGIFIWSARSIIAALAMYETEMNEIFTEGESVYNTPDEKAFIEGAFVRCVNISIDFAIMEKAENVYVLPVDFGWSDLGTWTSIYELSEKDYMGNVSLQSSQVIAYDTTNCMIRTEGDKIVILKGLHDFIVVDTPTAMMICPKNEEQNVKEIVADIKDKFGDKFI